MAGVHRDLEELQTSYGVFEGSTGFQTEENEAETDSESPTIANIDLVKKEDED